MEKVLSLACRLTSLSHSDESTAVETETSREVRQRHLVQSIPHTMFQIKDWLEKGQPENGKALRDAVEEQLPLEYFTDEVAAVPVVSETIGPAAQESASAASVSPRSRTAENKSTVPVVADDGNVQPSIEQDTASN